MALTREQIAAEVKFYERHHIQFGNDGSGGWLPVPPCTPLDFEPIKQTVLEFLELALEQEEMLPSDAEQIMEFLAAKYEVNYPDTAIGVYNQLKLSALPTEEKLKLIRALFNDIQAETRLLTTAN